MSVETTKMIDSHKQTITQLQQEIKRLELLVPIYLLKEFQEKYGLEPWSIIKQYMEFIWADKGKDSQKVSHHGHKFYIPKLIHKKAEHKDFYCTPYLQGPIDSSSSKRRVVEQDGFFLSDLYVYLDRIKPDRYQECLPTDQVIEAFKCFSIDIYIDPKITTQHYTGC